MKRVLLIGGSPTAGKSYIAKKIAKELGIPWISTDTIREQMREIVRKEDYPALFLYANATPKMGVDFLTKNSAKKIVEIVNKEGGDVWRGVKALIKTDYNWDYYIVEGVAITPNLISNFVRNKKNIRVLFLIDEDKNRIRNIIFARGLWDEAKKYPDHVKEKEVEWVIEFNNFIKKEAKKYGFPVVSIGNRKDYIKKIKRLIR